jgi:hypothetical protein
MSAVSEAHVLPGHGDILVLLHTIDVSQGSSEARALDRKPGVVTHLLVAVLDGVLGLSRPETHKSIGVELLGVGVVSAALEDGLNRNGDGRASGNPGAVGEREGLQDASRHAHHLAGVRALRLAHDGIQELHLEEGLGGHLAIVLLHD